MVDSIKSNFRSTASQTVPAKKDSLKSISSGLSVSQTRAASVASQNRDNGQGGAHINKIVDNLNEAVESSRQTLKALEDVASAAQQENVGGVKEFADDLDQLKSDIVQLLKNLRRRASTAEVLNENMQAADSKLEDVEKARDQAEATGSQIQFNARDALVAHTLTVDSVDRLLAE